MARDEAKNVAVILVDPEGRLGGMRSASVGSLSQRLKDQGLLDDVIVGLEKQFQAKRKPNLETLQSWHETFQRALYFSAPQPVAVSHEKDTLDALYKAFLSPAPSPRRLTKSVILDRVVTAFRAHGQDVKVAAYLGDFVFDAVVNGKGAPTTAVEVLSFATPRKDWTPVEKDAGHFLFALERLPKVHGLAVVQPPEEVSTEGEALIPYERVHRWFDQAGVPVRVPDELVDEQLMMEIIPG